MTFRTKHNRSRIKRIGVTTSSCSFSSQSSHSLSESSSEELILSRSHLRDTEVLQKKSIIVSGLPKSRFYSNSTKAVQEQFGKYGKICKCVANPQGLGKKVGCDLQNNKEGFDESKMSAYITYLNEKCSANAIKETDGTVIDESVIISSLATTRYCNEFLQGKDCDDLNCVLLHEIVKDHKNKQRDNYDTTPKTLISHPSKTEEVFRTELKNNCWDTPIRFLSRTSSLDKDLSENENKKSGNRKEERNDMNLSRDYTQVRTPSCTPLSDSLRNSNNHGESHIFSSEKVKTRPVMKNSIKISASSQSKHNNRFSCDLPARELFKSHKTMKSCVISPPNDKPDSWTRNKTSGYDNPWAFQSPIIITNKIPLNPKIEDDKISHKIGNGIWSNDSMNEYGVKAKDKLAKFPFNQPALMVNDEKQKLYQTEHWNEKKDTCNETLTPLEYVTRDQLRESNRNEATMQAWSSPHNLHLQLHKRLNDKHLHQLIPRQVTPCSVSRECKSSYLAPNNLDERNSNCYKHLYHPTQVHCNQQWQNQHSIPPFDYRQINLQHGYDNVMARMEVSNMAHQYHPGFNNTNQRRSIETSGHHYRQHSQYTCQQIPFIPQKHSNY